MIIEVAITESMKSRSLEKAQQMGSLNNSILSGAGNYVGFLGEEIANTIIGGDIANTIHYDISKHFTKFDVKSKKTSVTPKKYYDCSVADFNIDQICDFYVFTRILNDYSKGWILGFISKERFYEESRFMKKGQIDGTNNFKVLADCYNIEIQKLTPISELSFELSK